MQKLKNILKKLCCVLKGKVTTLVKIYIQWIGAILLFNILLLLLVPLLKKDSFEISTIIIITACLMINVLLTIFVVDYKMGENISKVLIVMEFIIIFILILGISGYSLLCFILFCVDSMGDYNDINNLQSIFYLSGIASIIAMPYLLWLIMKGCVCIINLFVDIFKSKYIEKIINTFNNKGLLLCRVSTYSLVLIIYISVKVVGFNIGLLGYYSIILEAIFGSSYYIFRYFKEQIIEICVAFTMSDCIIELFKQLFKKSNYTCNKRIDNILIKY
ncbi:MAG: hypothetical protein ACLU7E_07545 [Clostridium butyricum]